MTTIRRIIPRGVLAASLAAAFVSQASGGVGAFHEYGASAESQTASASLPLHAGEWRGAVAFDEGAVGFSIAIDSRASSAAPVLVKCADRTVVSTATLRENRRVTLTIDSPSGERLEGDIRDGSYVGYYHPPVPVGLLRTFPFRATRVETPTAPRVDFSGEWVFVLAVAEEPSVTVTALVGQGQSRVHAIWKEPDGTTRYFTGLPAENRLVLEEMGGGKGLILGRGDPAAGTLRGEVAGPRGRVTFVAHRRSAHRIINLAGL